MVLDNGVIRDFFLCAILTGAREQSLLQSRWEYIDLAGPDKATRHFHVPKMNKPHTIPVSRWLTELLIARKAENDRLYRKAKCRPWVFPSDENETGHLKETNFQKKEWKECTRYGGHFPGPHACRHTYTTMMENAQVPYDVAHLLTNHKLPGVHFGYITREATMERMRTEQERMTEYLLRQFGVRKAKVLPMRADGNNFLQNCFGRRGAA